MSHVGDSVANDEVGDAAASDAVGQDTVVVAHYGELVTRTLAAASSRIRRVFLPDTRSAVAGADGSLRWLDHLPSS